MLIGNIIGCGVCRKTSRFYEQYDTHYYSVKEHKIFFVIMTAIYMLSAFHSLQIYICNYLKEHKQSSFIYHHKKFLKVKIANYMNIKFIR